MKTKVASLFLSRFTPSAENIHHLTSSTSATSITSHFFSSLEAIHHLHKEATVNLLTLPSSHQVLGMEVIGSIESILENAYARLFKWTQRECRRMVHETPEIGTQFIQS